MKSKDPKSLRYLKFSSLGLEMGLAVGAGFYIGTWMDEKFDTAPWLLVFWVFAGLGAAFKAIFRAANSLMEEEKEVNPKSLLEKEEKNDATRSD